MKYLLLLLFSYSQLCPAQTKQANTSHIQYADSLLNLAGKIFYSHPDSSSYYTQLALNYAIKHKLEVPIARAWYSEARTEVLKGNIEQALKHLKEAAIVFEKYGERSSVAKCYSLMSTALSKIEHSEECVRLLLKASGIYRELKDENGLRNALVNLANTYSSLKQFDKALEALNESKLYIRPGDNQWFYYYINAGIIYKNQKRYLLAKIQFDSSLIISRRHNMVDAEVTAITDLALLYHDMQKYTEAIQYFNQAIAMARLHHLPLEESDALRDLVRCYEITKDYKNAFVSKNRLDAISDSLFNIEKIKNINAVEARLKVSEKEKTIALQKLDMAKAVAENEKSKKQFALLIGGTLVLVLILLFTFFVIVKVRRQKREVELQKTRAERLNNLNQKIFAVIAHDFKSPLITLNMLIDLLDKETISKEDLSSYSADVRNQITQSGQILENLLNWAKTELNLSNTGTRKSHPFLVTGEIIKELTYVSSRKNISILNEIPEQLIVKVPPDILKIIIRNLLSNAVKFSYSDSSVVVGLNEQNYLYVKDSGSGISEKTMQDLFNGSVKSKLGTFNETGFGLGLHITFELINKFNGKIWAENNSPSGTVFKFVFPHHD